MIWPSQEKSTIICLKRPQGECTYDDPSGRKSGGFSMCHIVLSASESQKGRASGTKTMTTTMWIMHHSRNHENDCKIPTLFGF